MPAVLTGPIRLLLLWGLLAVVVPTRSKGQESPSVLFLALCLDRDATALMSGELVPLKVLLGRKKSHLVLAVGMAAEQEPGRRVFLPAQCYCFLEGPWGSCWPGRVSMDSSDRELLRDRSMVTPFYCSQTSPWSRDPALACLLPLPAWSWCPKPFSAHRLQCWNSHWLVWDCERRGLWSGMFPWPHPEGLGLGSAGNQAGPSSQGQLHATRGRMGESRVTVAEKDPCQGCCWVGLALGEAALCGCSHCFFPAPTGTTRPAP